jgi:hypothetical protein
MYFPFLPVILVDVIHIICNTVVQFKALLATLSVVELEVKPGKSYVQKIQAPIGKTPAQIKL